MFDAAGHPPPDPAAAGWTRDADDGFLGLVGPLWSRRDASGPRFGFAAEPRHGNLVGIVHGGMLMTFADRGLGLLAWEAAGAPVVTISFDMMFVGAARIGSFVEMEGEVVQATRSLVFLRGRLFCETRTLASCHGTWRILSGRPAKDAAP